MVTLPTKQELEELRAFNNEPYCLSIYVPSIDPSSTTNPDRIELKNLLREAETALLSDGAEPKDVEKTLEPARALLDDYEFWPVHRESLALFMHPKLFRYYSVSDPDIPYLVTVEKGFNLDPLLGVIQDDKSYFVLALSHKDVELYQGDRYHLKPVELENFPKNMKQSLNIDEYPHSRETHNIAPASEGKGSEAYHEQYDVSKVDKAMLQEFFRLIDKRLHPFLQSHQLPLILAGVEYLQPIYRKINNYQHLLPEGIKGNLERSSLDDIRKEALSLIDQGK